MELRRLASRQDVWVIAFPAPGCLRDVAWWQRLMPAGYRHVLAFRAITDDVTLWVEHLGRRLHVELLPEPADAVAQRLVATHAAELLAIIQPAQADDAVLRGPMTCVEAVKALLGYRAPLVVTPRQLARHLRLQGAQRIVASPTEKDAA